ncbi:hypothetical protein CP969_08115 [Streptomyces viridosporus T7A]|uniref:Uncharacterized protein n=1 Tax=Streptomyces viridosporus T7A TaxID=665577 RepID=A0ABX6AQ56_STRVD|nr:hypothetical protein CP969_08115 [Streptomyces viridosporus T7A]
MTTPAHSATGRRRRVLVPPPTEAAAPARVPDPPVHRDPVRARADRGRAPAGRHAPERTRLAAPRWGPGRFSATPAPRGGGR